ncbi:hypothetical protein MXB_3752 [Myxobolus squamalis]|nr:hypothetical protein MXB_3752 [Myxobolus squamalis]
MGARHTKIIGDIHLLLGNYAMAIHFYQIVSGILSSFSDNLWLAATYEAIACACHFTSRPSYGDVTLFEIDGTTRRSSSEDVETTLRIVEVMKCGVNKYLIDANEYYRQYSLDKSFIVENHLIGVSLNYCIKYEASLNLSIYFAVLAFDRVKMIENIPQLLEISQLLIEILSKISYHRWKTIVMLYYAKKVAEFNYLDCFNQAESYLIEILNTFGFKNVDTLSLKNGWLEIYIEVCIYFMLLYKSQQRNNEAMR